MHYALHKREGRTGGRRGVEGGGEGIGGKALLRTLLYCAIRFCDSHLCADFRAVQI